MRRLIDGRLVTLLGLLWLFAGCGSAGTDAQGEDGLTMAFSGFDGEDIEQADVVTGTAAQVDVCKGLCKNGTQIIDDGVIVVDDEVTRENFTSTFVNALFTNRGKADIVLDSYTLNVPNSGVPAATRRISARLPGGRCLNDPDARQCVDNVDCGGGACTHTITPVTILLFDFDFKTRVQQGTCPLDIQDTTLDADLTFSGSDEAGQRFTIDTSYVSTFANFDNCETTN